MHDTFGPLYCETGHNWLFVVEPINTITNLAIFIAAFVAVWYVRKHLTRAPLDIALLILLLLGVAVGSALWHGLRAEWALTFDFVPGVLFLFLFVFSWMYRVRGMFAGVGSMVLLAALASGAGVVSDAFNLPFLFPIFAAVLIAGSLFVFATARRFGASLSWFAVSMMGVALAAAFFRTIDLAVCDIIPFGTHFLWHLLLSTAAFMAIVLLVRLEHTSARMK